MEAWGVVIVRHTAILIVLAQRRVVALLKGGSEGRPTCLQSFVLQIQQSVTKNALLSKGSNLL